MLHALIAMQGSTVELLHLSALIAVQGNTVELLHLSALIAVQGSTAQQLGPQVNPPAQCALLEHLLLLAL